MANDGGEPSTITIVAPSTIGHSTVTSLLRIDNGGTLVVKGDGANLGEFDALQVTGRIELNGGRMQIQFGNGFQPLAGQSFDNLSGAQLFGSLGVGITIVDLGPGLGFDDSSSANGLDLTVVQAPVPELSAILLLGAGLRLLAGGARRPRASVRPG